MTTVRRPPKQERSRALVEAILESAAALLARTPAQGVTTTMIAQGANCSPAALYRFFTNREAIFVELGDRYRSRLADMYEGLLDEPSEKAPLAVAREVYDTLVAFVRTEPGFRNLWWSGLIDATTIGSDRRDGKRYLAERLHALFEPTSPPAVRPGVAYVVCVEVADHLIGTAFEHDPSGDQPLLEETLRILALQLTNVSDAAG